jgi:hypothetical protein
MSGLHSFRLDGKVAVVTARRPRDPFWTARPGQASVPT